MKISSSFKFNVSIPQNKSLRNISNEKTLLFIYLYSYELNQTRQTNSEKLAYGFSQFKNDKKKKSQKMFKFEEEKNHIIRI